MKAEKIQVSPERFRLELTTEEMAALVSMVRLEIGCEWIENAKTPEQKKAGARIFDALNRVWQ